MKKRPWLRLIAFVIPYLLIVGLFQLLGIWLLGIPFSQMNNLTTFQNLVVTAASLIGTVLVIWLFLKITGDKLIDLGFHPVHFKKRFLSGFLLGAFIMIAGFLILYFSGEIKIIKIDFKPVELIYTILLFFIVAVMEELLVRGYILNTLMQSLNKYWALLISAVIFAALHLANPNLNSLGFINLILAGFFLGIVYIYTKNLWFPIALHFSWNLFQALLGYNVSGQKLYTLLKTKTFDNSIWSGFGFEASVLSVFFQVFFIISIAYYFEKRKGNFLDN